MNPFLVASVMQMISNKYKRDIMYDKYKRTHK